eukprot:3548583-Rhodomonas_salina.2
MSGTDRTRAMRCPVLPERMVLPFCAMSGTDLAYGPIRYGPMRRPVYPVGIPALIFSMLWLYDVPRMARKKVRDQSHSIPIGLAASTTCTETQLISAGREGAADHDAGTPLQSTRMLLRACYAVPGADRGRMGGII